MSGTSIESIENNFQKLAPNRPDRIQGIVFALHIIIAVIFSYYQYIVSPETWFSNFGLITPIFFGATGLIYAFLGGMNWYREEMLPYISRKFNIVEFQTDELIRFKRFQRLSVLIAGYLSTFVCQAVWTPLVHVLTSLYLTGNPLFDAIIYIPTLILIIYMAAWCSLFLLSEKILILRYRDIRDLIKFDIDWTKAMHETK